MQIVIQVVAGSAVRQQKAHDPSAREPNSKLRSLIPSPDASVVDGIKAMRPKLAPPTPSWGSATPSLSLGSAPFTPSISPDKTMGASHVSSAGESASEASSDAGDAAETAVEAGSIAAGTVTAIAAAGFALPTELESTKEAVSGSAVDIQTGVVNAAAMSLHADEVHTPLKAPAQAPASFAAPVKQHDCAGQSIALQGKVDLSEQQHADKTFTSDALQQRLVGAEQQQSADKTFGSDSFQQQLVIQREQQLAGKGLVGNGMQQRLVISEHQQSAFKTSPSDGLQQRLEMSEQQLAEETLTSDGLQQRLVGAEQQVAAVTDANQGLRLQLDGKDAELAGLRSRCKIPRQDFVSAAVLNVCSFVFCACML